MKELLTLLSMAFIGALIGGFTNHLAIKMLFRPHEAKYIGKWRLPFTPGLIPKRREELAVQLGKTVSNYLLTPDMLRKKFLTGQMEDKLHQFLQNKIKQHIFQSDKTIQDWLEQFGATQLIGQAEQKIVEKLFQQFENFRLQVTSGTVEEVIPLEWRKQIDERIPKMATFLLERAEQYVDSPQGKVMFQQLLNDFLASKGTFGGVLNMFFGDSESLVEKVQREALKFIHAPSTYQLVLKLLDEEWIKLQKRPMQELVGRFDWDGLFTSLCAYVKKELAIEERLDRTIQSYWPTGLNWTDQIFTPKLVSFAFQLAEQELETALKKLKLHEVVKEQVDTFPVAVLEDLVLGISRREFKMITVLGALLGGAIGIVQGMIVILTNLT